MSTRPGAQGPGIPRTGEVVVATSPTGGEEAVLDLGPSHPSAHGVLRLRLRVEDDVVVEAETVVGFLHRGAEKLFEVRDYRSGLALANRHDWHSAAVDEIVFARAVESMLGLAVPPRAVWLRTALVEISRVQASLAFLAAAPAAVGTSGSDAARATREAATALREELVTLVVAATGGRLHVMAAQPGGLVDDVPPGWLDDLAATVSRARDVHLPLLPAGLQDDAAFVARTTGAGVVEAARAASFGASGPVARAAGLPLDLRTADPDLAYAELAPLLAPLTSIAGDAAARYALLLAEVVRSLDLLDASAAALHSLGDGPVSVPLPKVLRVPEGTTSAWLESAFGITGVHLESRGDRTPYRLALRTPASGHAALLGQTLVGTPVELLETVVSSFFLVVGDIDK